MRLTRRSVVRTLPLLPLLLTAPSLAGCIDFPTFLAEPDLTLRVAVPDQAQVSYLGERIQSFQRDNPTIAVEIFSRLSIFRGNLVSGISSLVTSSNGLDAIYLTDQDFQSIVDSNLLTDLTPYIRETTDLQPPEFYPTALPAFQDRGRQMVLPAEMVPLVIFYNRDLFDKAKVDYPSPDWTTTEFLSAAKRLTAEGASAGFVCDPMTTVWAFALAFGGEFPDPAKDPSARALTSPAAIQGVQWFADLALREKVEPVPLNLRTLGLWFGGRAGMAALFMNTRNVVPTQTGPPSAATPTPGPRQTWEFRWDVAPIPQEARKATIVSVAGYAIPKGAKNPDEAWQLVRYLTGTLPGPGSAASYVPALKSLALSPDFSSLYPEAGRKTYLQSVEFGYTLPMLPSAARPSEGDLAPILRGDLRAADGLQRLREKMMPAFQQWVAAHQ